MRCFVALLVGAEPAAVQQRMQRLLLSVPRQAAQSVSAGPGVDAARLALGERAGEAAAAAGLLHQLTALRLGRTHGQRFLVAGLAGDVGGFSGAHRRQQRHQQSQAQAHRAFGAGFASKLRGRRKAAETETQTRGRIHLTSGEDGWLGVESEEKFC